jgi:hypothetical protein
MPELRQRQGAIPVKQWPVSCKTCWRCGAVGESEVKDSRFRADGILRRRRQCRVCKARWSTGEIYTALLYLPPSTISLIHRLQDKSLTITELLGIIEEIRSQAVLDDEEEEEE